MKKYFFIVIVTGCLSTKTFSQDTATAVLKRIEASVEKLKGEVTAIKDEIVKKDAEPFTGQSIFEDREGMSAIFLPYGGTLRLNTADASVKLSFINKVSNKKLFYGAEISGKTDDGILPLVAEGKISPGVKLNGVVGVQEFFSKSDNLDGWLLLKLGYEGSQFKLYDSSLAFASQFKDSSFNSFTSSLAFNLKIGGTAIVALSLGYQKRNNYAKLDEIEVTDTKTVTDPVTGVTRVSKTILKGRQGDYTETNAVPLNIDGFWMPKNTPRIGFYHFLHTEFSNKKSVSGLGTGIYLLKKKNPLASIAGIVFEVPDLSKLKDGAGKNFTINFVVGYSFGFKHK